MTPTVAGPRQGAGWTPWGTLLLRPVRLGRGQALRDRRSDDVGLQVRPVQVDRPLERRVEAPLEPARRADQQVARRPVGEVGERVDGPARRERELAGRARDDFIADLEGELAV